MEYILETLECPSCGAYVSLSDTVCAYCGGTFIRKRKESTLVPNSIYGGTSSANMQKAIELLDGRKPFLCDRKTIDKCLRHIEAAYEEAPSGLLDYFRAYIEYDYFERKHLNRKQGYRFYLERANKNGVTGEEISELERVLKNKISIGGNE